MLDIRIHGRGGHGNVTAAYLLAATLFAGGLEAQAFPAFGAERRGAPVTAFVRVARVPIRRRDQVRRPDILVIQDPTLLTLPATLEGLAPDGGVLVNAERHERLGPPPEIPSERWVSLPATRIAEQTLGRPIPNTVLLGAFLALTGLAGFDALATALAERFPPETAERNLAAARAGAERVPAGAFRRIVDARGP